MTDDTASQEALSDLRKKVEARVDARRRLAALPDGATCRDWRVRAGLSLRDVGDLVGVAHTTVLSWERGHHRPAGIVLDRYQVVLEALRPEDQS